MVISGGGDGDGGGDADADDDADDDGGGGDPLVEGGCGGGSPLVLRTGGKVGNIYERKLEIYFFFKLIFLTALPSFSSDEGERVRTSVSVSTSVSTSSRCSVLSIGWL